MDRSDLRLINLLVHDPRATYRDLADELEVSVQAVHRRVQQMIEEKIILGFSATISSSYLEAVPVTICGRSHRRTREETIKALEGSDLVSSVLFGSGGIVHVYCTLRRSSELDGLFEFVRNAALLKDAWIGLEAVPRSGKEPATIHDEPLTPLDRRVISSLVKDGRKASAEVAKELGVTAATVNRRLDRLNRIGAIEYAVALHPGFSGDIVSIISIELVEGSDRGAKIAAMRNSLGATVDYYRTFSNVPGMFTCVSWTKTLKDLEMLTNDILKDSDVLKAVPDIIFTGWYHSNWKDIMAMDVTHPKGQ
ncbi:MAG TPA: AsnC family transcriptional regulator [Methanomassiliicoccales archaeon]|nr:AsnC family transcriptional regulator [Methanomassiliicoccales archaeon]